MNEKWWQAWIKHTHTHKQYDWKSCHDRTVFIRMHARTHATVLELTWPGKTLCVRLSCNVMHLFAIECCRNARNTVGCWTEVCSVHTDVVPLPEIISVWANWCKSSQAPFRYLSSVIQVLRTWYFIHVRCVRFACAYVCLCMVCTTKRNVICRWQIKCGMTTSPISTINRNEQCIWLILGTCSFVLSPSFAWLLLCSFFFNLVLIFCSSI